MQPIKIKKINKKGIKPWDLNDYLYHLRARNYTYNKMVDILIKL